MSRHLVVVDGPNFVMRAYHGLATNRWADDEASGVRIMLLSLLKNHRPTHLVVANDSSGPSFRHELYPEYKIQRKDRPGPTPQELMSWLLPHFESWGVPCVSEEGYEADDVIATIVGRARRAGTRVTIVSNDSDVFQLLDEGVLVVRHLPSKGLQTVDVAEFTHKYGIRPDQFADFKALVGDRSDNIPRVAELLPSGRTKGMTPRIASNLLRRYATLEGIFENLSFLKAEIGSWLLSSRERVFFFRDLVRLRDDLPLARLDPRMSSVARFRLSLPFVEDGR